VLLDLVANIVHKSKHIMEGRMIIGNDNKLLVKVIINPTQKENQFTIRAGAEVSMIKALIAQLTIEIDIQFIKEPKNIIQPHNKDPLPYLIKICD